MKAAEKKKETWHKYMWYGIMFGAGMTFLFLFSTSTSPLLSNTYGSDSAFFQVVGQSMVKGQVIYRDIFDNKGPYLYLIQYLGQIISYGKCGIFILQIFGICISLYSIDHTCQLICGHSTYGIRVLSVCIFFFLLGLTLDGGNLSEEYSLPVLFICLYLFFWYSNNNRKTFFISVILGASFGFLAFIRVTNAGFICFLIFAMVVEMVLNKQFGFLFKCLTGIGLGFLGTVIPVCIYCFCKGVLGEMLYVTFVFNYLYGTHTAGRIRYGVISILFITALLALWYNRKERIYVIFLAVNLIGTFGVLLLGQAYIHYYQLIIPPVLANVWLLMRKYDTFHFRYKNMCLALAVLFLILINRDTLIYQSFRVIYALGVDSRESEESILGSCAHFIEERYVADWWENCGYRASEKVSEVLDQIDVNAYDSVYNYNTRPYWLRVSGLQPYNKYCQTQESFVVIAPHVKDEIDIMFCQKPPQYIVIENYEQIYNIKMLKRLEEEYYVKYQNEIYTLYERGEK